jgi:hypothetical protein
MKKIFFIMENCTREYTCEKHEHVGEFLYLYREGGVVVVNLSYVLMFIIKDGDSPATFDIQEDK